jgi:hypothetical protein
MIYYLIIEMTVYQDKLKTGVLSRKYFVFLDGIDLEIVASFLWFRSLSHGQGGRQQRHTQAVPSENMGTPWESRCENARAYSAFVTHAPRLPSSC